MKYSSTAAAAAKEAAIDKRKKQTRERRANYDDAHEKTRKFESNGLVAAHVDDADLTELEIFALISE